MGDIIFTKRRKRKKTSANIWTIWEKRLRDPYTVNVLLYLLTLAKMALFKALMQNGENYAVYPCSVFSPADPKILSFYFFTV
jgi:hypothetical protein